MLPRLFTLSAIVIVLSSASAFAQSNMPSKMPSVPTRVFWVCQDARGRSLDFEVPTLRTSWDFQIRANKVVVGPCSFPDWDDSENSGVCYVNESGKLTPRFLIEGMSYGRLHGNEVAFSIETYQVRAENGKRELMPIDRSTGSSWACVRVSR